MNARQEQPDFSDYRLRRLPHGDKISQMTQYHCLERLCRKARKQQGEPRWADRYPLCVGCTQGVRLRYSKICPWRKRQMLIVFAAAAKASRMASTGSSSRVLQFAQSTRRKPSIDQ